MRIFKLILLFCLAVFVSCDSNTEISAPVKSSDSVVLKDTTISFLWREFMKSEDPSDSISNICIDTNYCRKISSAEKAAIGYVATFIGNDCQWDGDYKEDRSNLKCEILSALNLGYQCSEQHLGFLRKYFQGDSIALKELENCPTTPFTATIQESFDEIKITTKGNLISVFFIADGVNFREQKAWKWSETDYFEVSRDHIKLVKKVKSDIEFRDLDFEEN